MFTLSFANKAYNLLCPNYDITLSDCYPKVPLSIRLTELRRDYKGELFDVKKEYRDNVVFFFECVAKLYLNTPFDCRGFFHSLDDKMFCALVLTIENDDSLFDRVYDASCVDDNDDLIDPVQDHIDDLDSEFVVDMFSDDYHETEAQLKEVNVQIYLDEMKFSKAMPILSQGYSDHLDNYSAYAHRLPLIIEIVSQLPVNEKIYAPGDGIGVVAIACILLKRDYWSSEPNGIGDRAFELGIINSRDTYEQFAEHRYQGIVILSNLARYCDLTEICRDFKVVVVDELCYYPGAEFVPVVVNTYGRIRSHYPLCVTSSFFDGINRVDKIFDYSVQYSTSDPRAFIAMQRLGYNVTARADSDLAKYVPTGSGAPVTYNFVGVTDRDDMILSYRKKAGAYSGRPGQYQYYNGRMYRFNRAETIRFNRRGFDMHVDRDYNSNTVLNGVLPTYDPVEYILGLDPTKFKYARVFKLVVAIRVISVVKVKNKYKCVIVRVDDHSAFRKGSGL